MSAAQRRGYAAAAAGKPITDNPYTRPVSWLAWRRAWLAYHERQPGSAT